MRRSLLILVTTAAALLGAARTASAGQVFINDVKLEGLLTQEVHLKNCEVRIDKHGNVYITAKGIKIRTSGATPASAAAEEERAVSQRYFLVTMQNKVGATQYKVDVYVNGKWVKQVHSKRAQEIFELTRYLNSGKNTIHLVATKDYANGPRISSSVADYYQVLIGQGQESAGRVLMERKLVEFRRTAEDTNNTQAAYTIKVR